MSAFRRVIFMFLITTTVTLSSQHPDLEHRSLSLVTMDLQCLTKALAPPEPPDLLPHFRPQTHVI